MKIFLILLCLLSIFLGKSYSHVCSDKNVIKITYPLNINQEKKIKERKLSEKEVKERGLDNKINSVIEKIEDIDIRRIARSHIIETPYGFRWKLFNVASSLFIVIKVDKKFNLISTNKLYL